MKHKGDLIVSVGTNLGDLTSITGGLYVHEGATLIAPHLTEVSGDLHVGVGATLGATLDAPRLIAIGWGLYVYGGATLIAPQLTSVSEYLYAYGDATLTAPLLTTAYGKRGREIARCPDEGYVLWLTINGLYYAGCRRGLTREKALAHWSGDNPRARLFTAAILNT